MEEVDGADRALQLLSAFFIFLFFLVESLPLSAFVTRSMCVEKNMRERSRGGR